ncbi:MAG: hypothetical protein ACQEQL_07770, partial [Pseudomonadota bacterium]
SDSQQQAPSFQYGTANPAQSGGQQAASAAAVKENAVDVSATHTKPSSWEGMQQPRGQRHGNTFIPPKPFTPEDSELFDSPELSSGVSGEEKSALKVTEPLTPTAPTAPTTPVNEGKPGFFERLTGNRRHDIPTAPPKAEEPEAAPQLNVQTGGKQDEEDELDIPAFLRRQAN